MSPSRRTTVPGEYIVGLEPPADVATLQALCARYALKRVQHLGGSIFLVRVAKDPGLDEMRLLMKEDARVKSVQPNFVYRAND